MEIRHLRYFAAVAEEGNFTLAAKRLRVAQPALSRQIRDLEEHVGARLMERGNRGVRLTPAGLIFLEKTRKLLSGAEDAVTAARRRHRGETGGLRIGFIGTLSQELLPRLLEAYHRAYPEVELVLHEMGPGRQREALLAGEIDLGFLGMTAGRRDPELELAAVAEEPLFAVLNARHPLAAKASLRLADLCDEPFIFTARNNAPVFNPWIIGLCRKAGFEPRVWREADRSPSALAYVAAGFGVSVFPAPLALTRTPGVVFKPLAGALPAYTFMLGWVKAQESGALKEFVGFAQAAYREAKPAAKERR